MPRTSAFTLEIGEFRGPLELLLDLIEQQKLQVNDISLAKVADEYVSFIEKNAHVALAETAQFVVVASTLLLIKSRSLLPSIELTNEEEADIRELEHRLKLYAHIRDAAKMLRRRWGKRAYLPQYVAPREIVFAPSNDITAPHLHQTLAQLLAALPSAFAKSPTAHIGREIRLEDVIESLTERMRTSFTDSFKRVTSGTNRVEAIVHFLALLELVKRGVLGANQQTNFSDITLQHEEIDTPHYG